MRLDLRSPGVILENSGYWGMRIIGMDKYDLRFYVNPQDYNGLIIARIISMKGDVLAEKSFNVVKSDNWEELSAVLTAKSTDYKATLQLVFAGSGKVYIDYVSLFPQNTFKGRKNGMRPDVAQMIANLKPGFLRWPGGCIAEGATLENRAKWKETLGDPMQRHSEWILWNYHCSWGFGYHEFLQFCEDIGAAGMFVANVGLSCSVRNGDWTEDYEPFLQDIIDAIDYATAPISNPWGAKRAAAGHPEPFNLRYVELGNEQVGDHYAQRYNFFYRILKVKYPQITFISTLQLSPSREKLEKADMIDPHWYVHADFFYKNDHLFDKMERGKYDIYIGEYAVITEANMNAALAEAAFLTGVERNCDLVKMASYAPLLQNNNRKDWPTNLIWYDNQNTMGRASYYVQQMYANNRPTYIIESGISEPDNSPSGHYTISGYDEQSGEIIIKVVNSTEKEYSPTINLNSASVSSNGTVITLSSLSKKDENTMDKPIKIAPVSTVYKKFKNKFKYTFKANSFTILRIKAKI
jgi:alpha-N-arabinofuranosidase